MNEIETIRKQIEDFFNAGDGEALDRLYLVLNELIADFVFRRALLGKPDPEPESEERLEMVDKDRLDKEGFGPDIPWRAKP
jgi:hypothetical protein